MDQTIKLKNKPILELGAGNALNYNISLLGTEALVEKSPQIEDLVRRQNIDTSLSKFSENFDEDDIFFYFVQRIDQETSQPDLTEVGLGRLISKGTELERFRPLYNFSGNNQPKPNLNGPLEFFEETKNKYVIVRQHTPTNMVELLVQTNSILASGTEEYSPIAVPMRKNSILGRLTDEIHSISIDDISDFALERIKKHTKQLILKSSQLNVRKVKVKQLTLDTCYDPDAKVGNIFYDVEDNTIKCFNGTEWKTISWKDG